MKKSKRIVVIGASGQVGSELVRECMNHEELELFPLVRQDFSLEELESQSTLDKIESLCDTRKPVYFFNTAAYHNVELCEQNIKKAYEINAYAPTKLAKLLEDSAELIHFSTDYVFGGEDRAGSYYEKDIPFPVNIYGASKALGEQGVINNGGSVVRISSVFGKTGCSAKQGGNFIKTCLRLLKAGKPFEMTDNQYMLPTYAKDLAKELIRRASSFPFYSPINHITNAPESRAQSGISWFELCKHVKELLQSSTEVIPKKEIFAPLNDQIHRLIRPQNSTLATEKNEYSLRPWKAAVEDYLKEIGEI